MKTVKRWVWVDREGRFLMATRQPTKATTDYPGMGVRVGDWLCDVCVLQHSRTWFDMALGFIPEPGKLYRVNIFVSEERGTETG